MYRLYHTQFTVNELLLFSKMSFRADMRMIVISCDVATELRGAR